MTAKTDMDLDFMTALMKTLNILSKCDSYSLYHGDLNDVVPRLESTEAETEDGKLRDNGGDDDGESQC